ncbi:hypothetical protein GCM10008927_29510 [Amylibacter ulvae]|uniref:Uncharacterized protein n=1 Tax=Paramylibacter ulvae TaxID=1651968 RepID=A0ABQ3D8C8_9RHOB|nr:hypothetical protein GCM10008927_29510 [Amylibacter ulvae]
MGDLPICALAETEKHFPRITQPCRRGGDRANPLRDWKSPKRRVPGDMGRPENERRDEQAAEVEPGWYKRRPHARTEPDKDGQ